MQRLRAAAKWQNWTDKAQKNAFLALMGAEAYDLLSDATLPDDPSSKTLQELVDILNNCWHPKKLPIAARYGLSRMTQREDTVAVYLRKLKGVAGNCNFGTQLDHDRLRDQLLCGLSNVDTLKKCLTSPLLELTLTKATDIAQVDKAVCSGQRQWLGEESGNILNNQAAEVHHIQQRNKSQSQTGYYEMFILRQGWTLPSRLPFQKGNLL